MKLQKRSHQESVRTQAAESSQGFAGEITRLGGRLVDVCGNIKDFTVEGAELSRVIGLELSAWMNREQMRLPEFESFFRQHKGELPDWLDSGAARKFISVHRSNPEPIKDLKTAVYVMSQMTFFALGLMDEPTRLLPQTASSSGPFEKLVIFWGKEREALQKFKEEHPISTWDEKIWFTVRHQTEEAAKLHAMAVEKLK